jgi:putative membrane protein
MQSRQLAADRAEAQEVITFATKMIDDHTKAGEKLKTVLQTIGMVVPSEEPSATDKRTINKLKNLKGHSFDRAYVTAQLQAHEQAVSLVGHYAKSGKTTELKQFAQEILPMLQEHLRMIQDINNKMSSQHKPSA